MATTTKTNKNKGRPLDNHHVRALQDAGNRRRIERMEARIDQMLTLLAKRPMYHDELAKEMKISLYPLYHVVRYAKDNNWIVSQGRYHLNPHTVMVAGGKVIRLQTEEGCVTV